MKFEIYTYRRRFHVKIIDRYTEWEHTGAYLNVEDAHKAIERLRNLDLRTMLVEVVGAK